MCTYTQREYSCGHFRWIATAHCSQFKWNVPQLLSKCDPDITGFQDRDFICGECKWRLEPLKHAYSSRLAWSLADFVALGK
ncbi:hypothetical protein VTJ49DRAFT_5864 [Mycothermus thermophilus]|uniref:Uncharacterized protein n=1 Tax=Humicola insolens TaxID=85995 RepID=A0ABR3V3S1_HUMIN